MAMTKIRALISAGATLLLLVAVGGCAEAPPTSVVRQHGATIVPADTIQDLVTYGDVAVVFTVVAERQIPLTSEELERGEGTASRQVTARQSGGPLWTRPSRSSDRRPASSWQIADGGWLVRGNEKTRLDDGTSAFEIGQSYLAIRTYSSIGGTDPEWFSLQYLPLTEGTVQFPADVLSGLPQFRPFQGLSTKAAAALLAATPPDPRAAPYMKLDAFERYQKIAS